jgi:hypothetical protein
MTFESFKQITDSMVKSSSQLDKTHEIGIDLLDFVESYHNSIHFLWGQLLTIDGLDWFGWFMYEKNYIQDGIGNLEMQAFSRNNEEQVEICKDLRSLYDYLKENNYFKCESPK